jgi:hypothetical protein
MVARAVGGVGDGGWIGAGIMGRKHVVWAVNAFRGAVLWQLLLVSVGE